MENGENKAENRLVAAILACEQVAAWVRTKGAKLGTFTRRVRGSMAGRVHKMYSALCSSRAISTGFTQLLRIQFVLNTADCGADVGVQTNLFLDFFDRVDGSGVVFAAQLFGDFRKAEV